MIAKFSRLSLVLFLAFSLAACKPQPIATVSTATPEPTQTAVFTPTLEPSPVPTQTAEPTHTLTPTEKPAVVLGPRQYIEEGGFSLQPPLAGYQFAGGKGQVGVMDEERNVILSFIGVKTNPEGLEPEEIVEIYLSKVCQKASWECEKTAAGTVMVDGIEGITYDVSALGSAVEYQGQTVLVMVNSDQYVFGLGLANTSENKNRWTEEGGPVFDALLHSIEFTQTAAEGETCPVSTDSSYGFTKENPIQVGGDWMDGPARERGYLDVLRGPKGEAVRYERTGTDVVGEVILDIFSVQIQGQAASVSLFVDMYTYADLQAPVGFTCGSPFSLRAP